MLSSKTRDLKVRKSFKSIEKRRLIDKFTFFSALNNSNSNKSEVLFNYVKLNNSKNIKSRSRTRFSSRCIISNRGRGIVRPFNVSRITLRGMFSFGVIPGYKKAVW